MKLFTLFGSDARAVEHVRGLGRKLARVFDRIDGCDEWGVRVTYDERPRRLEAQAQARAARQVASSGTQFLQLKRDAHLGARERKEDARERAARLHDELAARARESVLRPPPAQGAQLGNVIFDGAFLVPRDVLPQFRRQVERAAGDMAPDGMAVTLTGPWPAYHFVKAGR